MARRESIFGQRGYVRFAALATVALATALLAVGSPAQQISGTLSNFDVTSQQDEEMTNLELDIRNLNPLAVIGYYQGANAWGIAPILRDIGGTEVTWADFRNPVLPGQSRHFGLDIAPSAPFPCSVQAYWTQHRKIVDLPFPWQTWESQPGNLVIDRIRNDSAENVFVQRWSAVRPPIPLAGLVWDSPDIDWTLVDAGPIALPPGGDVTLEFLIPSGPLIQGVFVRYTVAPSRPDGTPDEPLVRFVNEAEVVWMPPAPPQVLGTLSNFDVHNDTGKPVHDLELELFGVSPIDIEGWYDAADAWGLFPDTLAPAIGFLPDGGGTEIHWVDEWNPLRCCEIRHFGVRLRAGAQPLGARLSWTRTVKVQQVPIPWQWWQTATGSDVLTDVIQLSDTFDEPVMIQRQWTSVPVFIELDQLTWDATQSLPWSPPEIVLLRPGDQTFVDILPSAGAEAVLVRYTASPQSGAVGTRVINEARLTPTGTRQVPQILGTVSNFDVFNATNMSMTNFELDMTLVQPGQILGWYDPVGAWGLHPTQRRPSIRALPQTEIAWADFFHPLASGDTRHFGLETTSSFSPPCGVQAYWTQHRKIFEIPVPWQTWRLNPAPPETSVTDVVRSEYPEAVQVVREFTTLPGPLPLAALNWTETATLPWQPDPSNPIVLSPGGDAALLIPLDPSLPLQAALVRYTVALASNPDAVVTRFVNEAIVELGGPGLQIPAIIGELSNFDARNTTGKPVHDLELDIQNIAPEDVIDWYRGLGAWGIDPSIRWKPGAPNVTEVTWIDDRDPIDYGETKHFGLIVRPGLPIEPRVRAYWTREVKVAQIPVPWQFWLFADGPFVRDVVQLSDTYPGPVIVNRQYRLASSAVPLDQLNWDLPGPWLDDPANPIQLDPGDQSELEILVGSTPPEGSAVIVRYVVSDPDGLGPPTRFVNEAVLGPAVLSALHFTSKDRMEWGAYGMNCEPRYDLVRGSISQLHLNNGLGDGTCMIDSFFDVFADDPDLPPSGDGFYYVVRAETGPLPGSKGTYDTTSDPVRREGRDAEIAGGAGDCP